MLTLGLNAFNHNASASFVRDGQLIYAAEEERFDRHKYSDAFPAGALAAGLKQLGLGVGDFDSIAYCWDWRRGAAPRMRYALAHFWDPVSLYYLAGLDRLPRLRRIRALPQELAAHGFRPDVLKLVPHHLAHAASAFFPSPFERAAVLTLDGVGEWETTWMGTGEGARLSPLQSIPFPHSLGLAYDAICQYLGFRKTDDAGKVMGLSAYGDPERFSDVFEDWLQWDNDRGTFRIDPRYITWPRYYGYGAAPLYSARLVEELGPPRKAGEPIEAHHHDVAAACQKRFEEIVLALARRLAKRTGLKQLCLAGGCALNCLANQRIREETGFSDVFVFPAAADAGAGAGAALWASVGATGKRAQLEHLALGPSNSDEECRNALNETGWPVLTPENLAETCADLLARGKILGWVQGRMEFGPRALGQRSLLADPRQAAMKAHMNERVKHRESFRPFAPVCPAETAGEFFALNGESPWMMFAPRVRAEKRNAIPAVTHEDGTARVQTVSRGQNPLLHDVLTIFGNKTGVPVLMNTSFNLAGDPVVASVRDAVACFQRTGIDALVAGPYLVVKSDNMLASR